MTNETQKVCEHCGGITYGDEVEDEFHDSDCPYRCDAAVAAEREECAKIADEQRELWSDPSSSHGGSAASATIARLIRERGKKTPERGGDVVDDAGPGGGRPSQPPPDAFRVPENTCLSCGQKLDSAARIEGDAEKPEPGNCTICMHCGHLMAFADDMTLRELNDQEAYDLAGDPTILRFQHVRGMVMAEKQEAEPWSQPASQPDDSEPPSREPPKND